MQDLVDFIYSNELEGRTMKFSVIAARLRKIALDMEVAARTNDPDFPDEMVTRLVANAFTDDKVLRAFMEPRKNEGRDRQGL
jgi:hypothetical protein